MKQVACQIMGRPRTPLGASAARAMKLPPAGNDGFDPLNALWTDGDVWFGDWGKNETPPDGE